MTRTKAQIWAVGLLVVVHGILLSVMLDRQIDFMFNDSLHRVGPATDFQSYYNAASHQMAGEGMYGHGPGFGYRYHPGFVLFMAPIFKALGFKGSFLLWKILNELLLLSLLIFVFRKASAKLFLPLAALLLLFAPYYLEVYMGNATFVSMTLLFWALVKRNGSWIQGLLLFSSIVIKPIALVGLPLFLVQKSYRMLVLVAAALATTAFAYFLDDPSGLREFLRVNLTETPPAGWTLHAGAQGLHALLMRILVDIEGLSTATLAGFNDFSLVGTVFLHAYPLLLVCLSVFLSLKLKERPAMLWLLWGVTYLLAYKDVWEHSYALLLPMVVFWADREPAKCRGLVLWALVYLALPTLYFSYHGSLQSGPVDPEHQWSLAVSLLHHSWKPLGAIAIYFSISRQH